MVILAPIAMQGARILTPILSRTIGNMGRLLIKASIQALNMIVFLPCGLVESTILSPWMFRLGLRHLLRGIIAPFKMVGYILLLPL